jgi:formylmethanofuran dehydrogenase subunit E
MPLLPLDEYIALAEKAHGHLCAGQILGVRLGIQGLTLLGLDDPLGAHRKRLITCVEIDRCATDAIGVVTGCRLGKRALKFYDFGKMAATFCDLESGRAVRVAALESSKQRAREMFPEIEARNLREMEAYRRLPDSELFSHQWVTVRVGPDDLPGHKGVPVHCAECGERINFNRQIERSGVSLCRACAGQRYYEVVGPA